MSAPSMLLTVGLMLNRAQEAGLSVRVCVGQHLYQGEVLAYDGTGLVLANAQEYVTIKADRITAVTVERLGMDRTALTTG